MEIANSNVATRSRFIPAAIGIGQGGTSAALKFIQLIGQSMERVLSINLSDLDLNGAVGVPEKNRLLLDPNMFGAGKNREVSKPYALEKKDAILEFVSSRLGTSSNILFVFYSLAGGTGSGLGPILTGLFESDALPKAPGLPTIVMGVPLLPDSLEGELGQKNTIEALKEISALSAAKKARFILVDNNCHVKAKNDLDKWSQINEDVAEFLKRYLSTTYLSKISNLDQEDRYRLLLTPGCHAFCSYNVTDPGQITTPFVLPEGALVGKMGAEIPEGFTESRLALANIIGATVDEPNFVGYYDPETQGAYPIVHFAGYSNLRKVAERHQNWLSQIQQKSAAAAKVDESKGSGFSMITKNRELSEKKNTTDTSSDLSDLMGLIEAEAEN